MAGIVLCILLGQTLFWTVPSTHAQRSIQQYLHLTGLPYSSVKVPATTTNNPVNTANQITSQPRPTTGLSSLSALSLPSLIAGLSQTKEKQLPTNIQRPNAPVIDGKLLNNLAIALQLLIVSNILNAPPLETPAEKPKEIIPEPPQNLYQQTQNSYNTGQNQYAPAQYQYAPAQYQYAPAQNQYAPPQNQYSPTQNQYTPPQNLFFPIQQEQVIPSANFVGTSNFGEPNIAQTYKPTRSGINLMSPYEALGTLSDPVSQFTVSNARKDFQSPYAMIEKDVFSSNDLFS